MYTRYELSPLRRSASPRSWAVGLELSAETRMSTPTLTRLHEVGLRETRARRRDFYHRYDLLLANWYSLTIRIQQKMLLVRQALHDDLACWRPEHPEPDWNAYANRVNMICSKGGSQHALGSTK